MSKQKTVKKVDTYPLQVELEKYTELVKYVLENRSLLENLEVKNLAEFEANLNKKTSFVNANLSAEAMGFADEHKRLTYIEKILSTVNLKDSDIDSNGEFTNKFIDTLNEKHTIYFTEDEEIINKKIDSIMKSYNSLAFPDRKKIIINRSGEMQINPFIRY